MTDDVHTALDIMKREKIHRLPVVDEDGVLQGIIAMNDLILAAGEGKGKKASDLSYEDMMRTMKAINEHRILVGI